MDFILLEKIKALHTQQINQSDQKSKVIKISSQVKLT
jgi:hypothetical protein